MEGELTYPSTLDLGYNCYGKRLETNVLVSEYIGIDMIDVFSLLLEGDKGYR